MYIDINIYTLKDCMGNAIAYEPQVTVAIDNNDQLDFESMKKLRDTLQREVADGITSAHRIYMEKHQALKRGE